MTTIDHDFQGTRIIHGDVLHVLPTFPDGLFGGIITDPPYASGAADQNAKQRSTAMKYCSVKTDNRLPNFEGDAKDQRSWTHWMAEWLTEARRVCVPGAPICMFIDWRQLPSMTDALQWAGWIWRGVLAWDKINSRPRKGASGSRQSLWCGAATATCHPTAEPLFCRECSGSLCLRVLSATIRPKSHWRLCEK